jgi:carbamate kinase
VPSPRPLAIVELDAVKALTRAGTLTIACGGGGIAVVERTGALRGVDAVVDKDWASSLLARGLGAKRLVVLTDVPAVLRDYGTPQEQEVRRLTPTEADALVPELAQGSMAPKVEACAEFVRATGGEALITSAAGLEDALAGRAGTLLKR